MYTLIPYLPQFQNHVCRPIPSAPPPLPPPRTDNYLFHAPFIALAEVCKQTANFFKSSHLSNPQILGLIALSKIVKIGKIFRCASLQIANLLICMINPHIANTNLNYSIILRRKSMYLQNWGSCSHKTLGPQIANPRIT